MLTPANGPFAETPRPEFAPGRLVWVYCSGSWRPGVILSASAQAAIVRYRPTESRGTAVDTVMAHNIALRDDADPYLDQLAPSPDGILPSRAAYRSMYER
ncbi:MAG TPA: hypothetical protein VH561_07665 [Micromonosporaceae bacterium]|jgi:hypothetical protein